MHHAAISAKPYRIADRRHLVDCRQRAEVGDDADPILSDAMRHQIGFLRGGGGDEMIDMWVILQIDAVMCFNRQRHVERAANGAANARTSEFIDTMNNNLQAIWTGQVSFEEGVETTYTLCQEVLDKDPL